MRKTTLTKLVTNPISKCKFPKLEKSSKSVEIFLKFLKTLNGHEITPINDIELQFSIYTFHIEAKNDRNFERKTLSKLG